jgi:hypothetical protein|tara:strand:- start:1418 stop:1720 length:303 start_codon:yes stop_codon:yes gene_type:complete
MIKNEESLLQKTILLKRRTSSTIPFGYELSEKDNEYLKPIEEQLDALQAVEEMIIKEEISLRDGCYWLENHTGRRISPPGLKKIIDKKYGKREERLNRQA